VDEAEPINEYMFELFKGALVGGFLFSLVDSWSRWWIPIIFGGFLFSLVDSWSRWWIPIIFGGFLFSLVDSCSH
jgi:acyl-coenzyme A thioesterase PaaI-like protein